MAESTLSLDYVALMNFVSRFLGYGDDYTALSAGDSTIVDTTVQSGYRQFLFPPPAGGQPHSWTFLKPVTTIVAWSDIAAVAGTTVSQSTPASGGVTILTAEQASFYPTMIGKSIVIDATDPADEGVGTFVISGYTSSTVITVTGDADAASTDTFAIASNGDYQLPDDFGAIEGNLTFEPDITLSTIPIVGESQIRQMRQWNTSTGIPRIAAIRPKSSDGSDGQRFELMLQPEPSTNYTLSYSYEALINKLTTTYKYPLGGMAHAETIKESCLAAAEALEDDNPGSHNGLFMQRLATSIRHDNVANTPEYLGYNSDRSVHSHHHGCAGRCRCHKTHTVNYVP